MGKRRRLEDPAPSSPLEWRFHPLAAQTATFLAITVAGVLFYTKMPSEQLRLFWSHCLDVIPPVTGASGPALLTALRTAAWLILLHLAAWGLGTTALRVLGIEAEERLEGVLLGSAMGWGVIGMAMLGLGMAGLWRTWTLALILGSGLAGLAYHLYDRRHPGSAATPALPAGSTRWSGWEGFLVLFLMFLAAFDFFAAFMPEIFYDALVYHLGLPELYWTKGAIVPVPELLYSGLPLMVQMLYAAALPLGGDALCRVLHWSFGVETVLLTFALGRRLAGRNDAAASAGRGAGLLAAALFYGIPLVSAMSWKSAVELGQAVFQTAALLALVICVSRADKTRPWALAAGLLTGFAMGSKYQAWPMLPVLCLALLWVWRDRPEKRRDLLVFAGAAVLAVAPWCVKNILHYGNPLYPIFHEYFGGSPVVPRWRELMGDAESVRISEVLGSWKSLLFWLTHPWRIPFENMDHGSILFMVLPVVLLGRFRAGAGVFCWLSWLGLWLSWSLTTRMVRYALPNLPLACALTALALEAGFAGRVRTALRALLVYIILFETIYAMTWFHAMGATQVVLGRGNPSDYLAVVHPSYHCPVQPAIDFINSSTPPDAKVLFLGEGRRYGCKREAIVMSYYDEYPLQWWLGRSSSAEDIRRFLAEARVTHILVNRLELARWQGPDRKYLRVTEEQKNAWSGFMSAHATRVFQRRVPETGGPVQAETAVYELDLSTANPR
ncbi:MAG: glycosyltransferase family 39 protein [Elusimicrobia bacterium]|nr:glycosyltransferase family 39 protein [Elusimicrobiota bacterium]MBI5882555.1 glycosyltransferase family 39 protein [Elusimicrobiota bacterium]